jgi:hypothetical protein
MKFRFDSASVWARRGCRNNEDQKHQSSNNEKARRSGQHRERMRGFSEDADKVMHQPEG